MRKYQNISKVLKRRFGSCSLCCHNNLGQEFEYGFEIQSTHIKFGENIISELGYEAFHVHNMKRIAILTDKRIRKLHPFQAALESLEYYKKMNPGVSIEIYDEVQVEPTDESCKEAIKFASSSKFDGFISIGGGSVIDTTKIANLYSTHPTNDFLKHVNAPIGKGEAPISPLKPHIAIPTTCGTGSEATGFAIFDLLSLKAKTGIGHKYLIPSLALIDPNVTKTLTPLIVACSGFDTLSHAIESYTAIPYKNKSRPKTPKDRPLHQGSNPYSDFGCLKALNLTTKHLLRAYSDPTDLEAREQLLFASTLAGTAMGNAGTHLPHGMSYPVSALVKEFRPKEGNGYPTNEPLIPHGMSVILHAPSVFSYLSKACPHRLYEIGKAMEIDMKDVDPKDSGKIVSEKIISLMKATKMPSGLEEIGFTSEDIPQLVSRAFPQKRVINNAPIAILEDDLTKMYNNAMKYW